jgi:hypothetical protein
MMEGGVDTFNITYGAQDHQNRYYVNVDPADDSVRIFKYENGDSTSLNGVNHIGFSTDTWYWVEVNWGSDGSHNAELYDIEDTKIASVSATDSEWTEGGFGYDAYLADQGTLYIDHVLIGSTEYHSGGWGAVKIEDRERLDTLYETHDRIENLRFWYNYDGREPLGSDEYIHYFTVGAVGHTYAVPEDETNPTKDEVEAANYMEQSEITIDLNNYDSSDNQYLYWNDQKTWAWGYTDTEWADWKNRNWSDWAQSEDAKQKAVDENKLNAEEENEGLFDLFVEIFGLIPVLGDVISGIHTIADLANDGDACEYYKDPNPNKVYLRWDACNKGPLMGFIVPFRVEIPKGESLDISVDQVFTSPSNTDVTLTADNAASWKINIPADGQAKLQSKGTYSNNQ